MCHPFFFPLIQKTEQNRKKGQTTNRGKKKTSTTFEKIKKKKKKNQNQKPHNKMGLKGILQLLFLGSLFGFAILTRKGPQFLQRPKNFQKDFAFGPFPSSDHSIRPFTIAFPEPDLQDLKLRLNLTRLPAAPHVEGVSWGYGANQGYMEELVEHWRERSPFLFPSSSSSSSILFFFFSFLRGD
jgi:hypothetical protein